MEPGLLPPGICSNLDISIDLGVPRYASFETPISPEAIRVAQPVPGTFTVRPPLPGSASSAPARLGPSRPRSGGRSSASWPRACRDPRAGGRHGVRAAAARRGGRRPVGARDRGALIGHGIVQPVLTEAALAGPGPARTLPRQRRPRAGARSDIVRVKIWSRRREDPLLRRAAADRRQVHARRGRHRRARDGRDRRRHQRSVEAREPVRAREWTSARGLPSGHGGAERPDRPVRAVPALRRGERQRAEPLAPVGVRCCSRAIALVWLLQIPFAWKLARRLRAGHEERERLLQRAVDSSNVERRRIASDLHDGVIPQLAGTAYVLGAARQRVATAPRAETEGALTRERRRACASAIQQLRSLIVDIHPPNLETVGLAGALEELAAGVPGSASRSTSRSSPTSALGLDAERLLFRGAQEALRNVVAHAHATRATSLVAAHDGGALLVASDDGVGFTPRRRRRSAASEGHVGLGLLPSCRRRRRLRSRSTRSRASAPTVRTVGARTMIRVLVVDDHAVVRLGVERALERPRRRRGRRRRPPTASEARARGAGAPARRDPDGSPDARRARRHRRHPRDRPAAAGGARRRAHVASRPREDRGGLRRRRGRLQAQGRRSRPAGAGRPRGGRRRLPDRAEGGAPAARALTSQRRTRP